MLTAASLFLGQSAGSRYLHRFKLLSWSLKNSAISWKLFGFCQAYDARDIVAAMAVSYSRYEFPTEMKWTFTYEFSDFRIQRTLFVCVQHGGVVLCSIQWRTAIALHIFPTLLLLLLGALKMREWKNREQVAGVENAEVESAGVDTRGLRPTNWADNAIVLITSKTQNR